MNQQLLDLIDALPEMTTRQLYLAYWTGSSTGVDTGDIQAVANHARDLERAAAALVNALDNLEIDIVYKAELAELRQLLKE